MIKVVNLRKSFGDLVLFDNLSFEIKANRMTCIHGKSGSGKTTLLNILGGIEGYDKGSLYYKGKEMTKRNLNTYLSNDFGFVFQNYGLIDNLNVYENMMIIKRLKKMNKKSRDVEISQSLKEVGLEGFERKKIYELSGGEQQRVAIAKIIAKNCDIVFADEPTASLDTVNRNVVMELFAQLLERGKTIIIVSHDTYVRDLAEDVINL